MEQLKNWNVERWVAILGFLFTVGFGGYLRSIWSSTVEIAVIDLLNDRHTELYHIMELKADSLAEVKYQSMLEEMVEDEVGATMVAEEFEEWRGMEGDELKDYIDSRFDFADEVMRGMSEKGLTVNDLMSNHEGIDDLRATLKALVGLGTPVGGYISPEGAFLYRWYNGQSYPVKWTPERKPYVELPTGKKDL